MGHLKIFHHWKIFQNLQGSLYKINSEKHQVQSLLNLLKLWKALVHSFFLNHFIMMEIQKVVHIYHIQFDEFGDKYTYETIATIKP